MKRVDVRRLSGGEILARDLYTHDYGNILMPRGTVLKKEYIAKLLPLGITVVYIEEKDQTENEKQTNINLMQMCQNKIKHVMERHIYKHNEELKKLCVMAENIIMEAVSEKPMMEKILEIQEAVGDIYTHSMHVCTLSAMLALKCGMEKEAVQDTLKGGLLHDIGIRYITVPYENIMVDALPKGPREEYRHHTVEGYKALEQESWISPTVKDIIFYHHERLDGSGYPLRLCGDRLSLPVKIVSVCDAFDERIAGIGHKRCHLQETLEFLRDNKGILFDQEVTEAFLKMVIQYPTGCVVRISTGEIGRVIYQNRDMPERPVVLLLQSESGAGYTEAKEVNLMKELNVFIVEILNEK